jgi:hypothetical protein
MNIKEINLSMYYFGDKAWIKIMTTLDRDGRPVSHRYSTLFCSQIWANVREKTKSPVMDFINPIRDST